MDLVEHLRKSLFLAERSMSSLDVDVILKNGIKGQSGVKNMCLLNNLCSVSLTYLEIGLFGGLSFASALMNNSVRAFGIDDWSEFGGSPETFVKNMSFIKTKSDAIIVSGDCFSFQTLQEFSSRIAGDSVDVFYYDGGHSEEDHYNALGLYGQFMSEEFVFIVDDWQQLDVQRGTLFAIRDFGFEVLWEKHCESVNCDVDNWWCGTYIAVLRKEHE